MATKQYTQSERTLAARARSKRRRETGGSVGSGGGSVTVVQNVTAGSSVTQGDGHTHANKSSLDQLSVASGYVKVGTAKAKAGYADEAGRSTESTHASTADRATLADRAVAAQEADHAATATQANHAQSADLATLAENLTPDSTDWDTIAEKIDTEIGKLDAKYLSKVHDDTARGRLRFEDLLTLVRGMMLGDARLVRVIQAGGVVSSDDTALMTVAKQIGTFLRKDTEDETRFLLRLLGGAIFTMLKSPDYVIGGMLGTGLGLYKDANNQWCIETDRLYVRVKAIFNELEIRKLSYAGGNILLSPAGSRIINVVEQADSWRCYVKADDGETATMNWWRVGDQARCQTFNVKADVYQNVENRYYWRLVTGVGDDYVDLSKTDCDAGSDTPAAGDSIVQLGNRTDTDRQAAILLATCDAGAPAITQYSGIRSYSLVGTVKTRISPSGNLFTGDFYLTDGRSLLAVTDGKIASVVSETVRTQGEKDNWLRNGSFTSRLDYWQYTAGTSLFTVGDDYVQANTGALSVKGEGACWVSDGGHPGCYIGNSAIVQRATDYVGVPLARDGSGGKKDALPVRLVLYYKVLRAGHLVVAFDGEAGRMSGYNDYEEACFDDDLEADSGYHQLEITGGWSGLGDLRISFSTGQIVIRSVTLWLNEYTYYESRIEQTAQSIRLSVQELSQTVSGHTTSIGALEVRATSIEGTVSSHSTTLGTHTDQISNLVQRANSIEFTVNQHTTTLGTHTSQLSSLSLRADGIDAAVSSVQSTANGNSTSIASLSLRADALETTVGNHGTTLSGHGDRLSAVEQTAGSIQTRVSAIEGDYVTGSQLTQTANSLSARISEVNEGREGKNLLANSLVNETSNAYGFGRRSLRLRAGETYTLSACGLVPYEAYQNGMELQVHIWRVADSYDTLEQDEEIGVTWRNSRFVTIGYNGGLSETKDTSSSPYESAWVADRTGEYFIGGYMAWKNGTPSSGGTRTYGVSLLWLKVEQGAAATGWVAGADDAVNLVNYIANPLAVKGTAGETECGTQTEVTEAPFGQVLGLAHYVDGHWQRTFERRSGYGQLTGHAVTFWMVCRSLDGYGRWVTDSGGTDRQVRLCFGDGNKANTVDTKTSDFIDLGGGWRKYWCVRYMEQDLGATVGLCHAVGRWRVYAVGIVAGCVCPGIRDIMEQNGLLATGIDIEKKEVTVTADNFKVRNNAGVETMLVDANGKLSTPLINAQAVVASGISAQTINAGNATFNNLHVGGESTFGGLVYKQKKVLTGVTLPDYRYDDLTLDGVAFLDLFKTGPWIEVTEFSGEGYIYLPGLTRGDRTVNDYLRRLVGCTWCIYNRSGQSIVFTGATVEGVRTIPSSFGFDSFANSYNQQFTNHSQTSFALRTGYFALFECKLGLQVNSNDEKEEYLYWERFVGKIID